MIKANDIKGLACELQHGIIQSDANIKSMGKVGFGPWSYQHIMRMDPLHVNGLPTFTFIAMQSYQGLHVGI